MNAADKLLPRLDGVRELRARPGRVRSWTALCPAHDDKHPSLDIDLIDDRLLLCCRTGCSAGDVVGAVGLDLADLFDRPTEHYRPGVRAPLRPYFNPSQALPAIQHEALVVVIVAEGLARGEPLSDEHHRRLIRAAATISTLVERSVRAEPPELRRLRRGEGRPA